MKFWNIKSKINTIKGVIMLKKLLAFIRSLWFCIKMFGIKEGIRIPVLISPHTKVSAKKGSIIIPNDAKYKHIMLGFGGSKGVESNKKNSLILSDKTKLIFLGQSYISSGFSIRLDNSAEVVVGKNFNSNKNLFLSSSNKIEIGNNVLLGWNVEIRDSDGHTIIYNNDITDTSNKQVFIGDDVWIASQVLILGKSYISENSVVGIRSMTNKKFESHSLIAGSPARKIKTIQGWNR